MMVWWFPSTGGARRGAFPLDPMEYVLTEGTASPYDVMYDTVHAVPATPVSVAQSEYTNATYLNNQRKLVRTSDGTLYAVYPKKLGANYQIYVIKSEDDGATWTDDTRISTAPDMATKFQTEPSIAVDSEDNLHVVWHGAASDFAASQIRYAMAVPPHAAGDWVTPIRISTYANMSISPQYYATIAVDSSDNLHVGWYGKATGFAQNQVWYATAVSPYAAGDWVAPIRISTYNNMILYSQSPPCIAVDSSDNLHAVFYGRATGFTTQTQTWYTRGVSPYAAANWTAPIRISTYANMSTNNQNALCIAVDSSDNLHVVWMGLATGFTTKWQVWYATAVSPYAAGDWVAPIRISDALNMALQDQLYPSIAVDSSDSLYVVWHGKATGYLVQNVVWLAVYVISWATPEVLQPTGRNQYPVLRWSRWPR